MLTANPAFIPLWMLGRLGAFGCRRGLAQPPAAAKVIALEVAPEVGGVAIDDRWVADHPMMKRGASTTWTFTFWNAPARGLDHRLQVPVTPAVRVTATTGTPGLPSIPGTAYRERPPNTMPISPDPATIEQDSSTVISKTFTFATPVRG